MSSDVGAPEIISAMAYDHDLADRVRELVAGEDGVTEQRMFGGLAFLINGNMSVAASGEGGLLVRVDPAESETLLDDEGVGPMVMRGRAMRGWLRVDAAAVHGSRQLERWVTRGVAYARSLPAKAGRR
jgi:TfoX/Sxy family transcriptional regulator of competence genes